MDIEKYHDNIIKIFGASSIIKNVDESCVVITNELVKATLYYDRRDGIINSFLEPIVIDQRLRSQYDTRTLLKMLGFLDEDPELIPVDRMNIAHELRIIEIAMEGVVLAGEEKIKEAFYFNHGYGVGYTDGMNDSVRPIRPPSR